MSQIGAQMYTLRDYCETPADIAKTCKRLRDIGFRAIQASAAGFGTIDAKELKKILDDNDMVCAATHRGLDEMRDADRIAEYHQIIGCDLTALGGFGFDNRPKSDWQQFAKDYSEIGRALAAKGLLTGYHNHSHEFVPFATDPAELDPTDNPYHLLANELDKSVWFEVDTYWVAHGGADPAAWIRRLAGRVPAIHVKDITINAKREHKMCEVGRGNLNWPAIIEASRDAGVRWYLIERDAGDLDPFQSLQISFEELQGMLAG